MNFWWILDELKLADILPAYRDFAAQDGSVPVELPARTHNCYLVKRNSAKSTVIKLMAHLTLPISGSGRTMYGVGNLLLSDELDLEGFYSHITTGESMPANLCSAVLDTKQYAVKILEDANIGFSEYRFGADEESKRSIHRGLTEPKLIELHRQDIRVSYQVMYLVLGALLRKRKSQFILE